MTEDTTPPLCPLTQTEYCPAPERCPLEDLRGIVLCPENFWKEVEVEEDEKE